MIGRLRAAWDEAGRLSNHRRGSNPMTREEWKSAELRQGDILARVEMLAELNTELLRAMHLVGDLLNGLGKVRDGESQILNSLIVRMGVCIHCESGCLLGILAGAVVAHESSPPCDGAGAHSVGDGAAAGDETASPASGTSPAERGNSGRLDHGDRNSRREQQGVPCAVFIDDRKQGSLAELADSLKSIERILRGSHCQRVDDSVVADSVVGVIGHDASPSVGDAGAHSVGEGEVAGVETAAPVTDATGLPTPDDVTRAGLDDLTRQIADYLEVLHDQGNSWSTIARLTRHVFTTPSDT